MPYLLLALGTLFWASNFIIARALHLDMPPVALAFWRWSLALLLLLPIVWPSLYRQRQLLLKHWRILLLLSFLGVANFNTCVYLGVQTTTATNAALLQSAIPVVILLLARLFLKQPVAMRQYLGISLSLAGVLLIISHGQWRYFTALDINRGDLWVLAAVVSWSLYSICLRWRPAEISSSALLGSTVTLGVVILLLYYLLELVFSATGPATGMAAIQWQPKVLMAIVYLAVFPSLVSYFCWNRGVAELGAARAGLFTHLIPVYGLLMSHWLLGEQVQAFHLGGIFLIFVGLLLASFAAAKTKRGAH